MAPNGPQEPRIPDAYHDLGLSSNAPAAEIKTAYKRLALIHHPDKQGDVVEFRKIQEAFELLREDDRKAKYDCVYEETRREWVEYRREVDLFQRDPKAWQAANRRAQAERREREQAAEARRRAAERQRYYNSSEEEGVTLHDILANILFSMRGGRGPHGGFSHNFARQQEEYERWQKQKDQEYEAQRQEDRERIRREKAREDAIKTAIERVKSAAEKREKAQDGLRVQDVEAKRSMARRWVEQLHKEHAQALAVHKLKRNWDEPIELGWERKKGKGRCDFCNTSVHAYLHRCPSGGAIACRGCKNSMAKSSPSKPFNFQGFDLKSKKAKDRKEKETAEENIASDEKSKKTAGEMPGSFPSDEVNEEDQARRAKREAEERERATLAKKEKAKQKRIAREKTEQARVEREKAELERAACEKAEQEEAKRKKAAEDEAARQRGAEKKAAKEKAAQEKAAQKKTARKAAARERIAIERQEREQKEQGAREAREAQEKKEWEVRAAREAQLKEEREAQDAREADERFIREAKEAEERAIREAQEAKEKAAHEAQEVRERALRKAQEKAARKVQQNANRKAQEKADREAREKTDREGQEKVAREAEEKTRREDLEKTPRKAQENKGEARHAVAQQSGAATTQEKPTTGNTLTPTAVSKPKDTRPPQVCYSCNTEGHFARNCPLRKQPKATIDEIPPTPSPIAEPLVTVESTSGSSMTSTTPIVAVKKPRAQRNNARQNGFKIDQTANGVTHSEQANATNKMKDTSAPPVENGTPKINKSARPPRPPPVCFACNDVGHIARNCPAPPAAYLESLKSKSKPKSRSFKPRAPSSPKVDGD
ncbi:hypothetical protein CC80DRAFT_531748 [Byssothecium circinans]|uniref:DnaJ-domain-containing protein n=1 Tax=Byssothecium circinans TaxID=147558 RepID=A0A6A5UAQ8_9PLEO|nr:hypothetical protein CC80DRAFT_531748 [Byssothecium circinans]